MKTFLGKLWDVLSGSFWFVPGLMAIGSVFLVIVTIWIDIIYEVKGFGLASFLVAGNMETIQDNNRTRNALCNAINSNKNGIFSRSNRDEFYCTKNRGDRT